MTDDTVAAVQGARKSFGDVVAVDGPDITVRAGEMFGLVGPDGAGKTTLVRMLCGILAPDAGTVRVLGLDPAAAATGVKRRIGYLSQQFSLYGDLSVDENIAFFAELHGVRGFDERRKELLAFTRLTEFRERLADRLSGGMKQKLALACTLVHTPEIIFLDEPTTGVDPVSRRDFWKILADLLGRGITVFMTTPYLDEAERCGRVALMDRGRLLVTDTPDRIRARMDGRVFEVTCPRVRDAARVLREGAGNVRVQAFGDRLHAVFPDAGDHAADVRRVLDGAGIRVTSVGPKSPSLENAFIELVDGPEEAA